MKIDQLLSRWRHAGGSERANYQLFIADLYDLLEVDKPQPASVDTRDTPYVFERRVVFHHGDGSTSNGFIDCYKRRSLIGEGPWKKHLPQMLETLVALVHARQSEDGLFGASR